jgi:hypothetical protein
VAHALHSGPISILEGWEGYYANSLEEKSPVLMRVLVISRGGRGLTRWFGAVFEGIILVGDCRESNFYIRFWIGFEPFTISSSADNLLQADLSIPTSCNAEHIATCGGICPFVATKA